MNILLAALAECKQKYETTTKSACKQCFDSIVVYESVQVPCRCVLFKRSLNCIFLQCSNGIHHYDVVSGSEITPCNKIDKPLFLHRNTCLFHLMLTEEATS